MPITFDKDYKVVNPTRGSEKGKPGRLFDFTQSFNDHNLTFDSPIDQLALAIGCFTANDVNEKAIDHPCSYNGPHHALLVAKFSYIIAYQMMQNPEVKKQIDAIIDSMGSTTLKKFLIDDDYRNYKKIIQIICLLHDTGRPENGKDLWDQSNSQNILINLKLLLDKIPVGTLSAHGKRVLMQYVMFGVSKDHDPDNPISEYKKIIKPLVKRNTLSKHLFHLAYKAADAVHCGFGLNMDNHIDYNTVSLHKHYKSFQSRFEEICQEAKKFVELGEDKKISDGRKVGRYLVQDSGKTKVKRDFCDLIHQDFETFVAKKKGDGTPLNPIFSESFERMKKEQPKGLYDGKVDLHYQSILDTDCTALVNAGNQDVLLGNYGVSGISNAFHAEIDKGIKFKTQEEVKSADGRTFVGRQKNSRYVKALVKQNKDKLQGETSCSRQFFQFDESTKEYVKDDEGKTIQLTEVTDQSGATKKFDCKQRLLRTGKVAVIDVKEIPDYQGTKLNGKFIYHAVGPDFREDSLKSKSDEDKIKALLDVYNAIFEEALKNKHKTIAIPFISIGAFQMPADLAVKAVDQSIRKYKDQFDKIKVYYVGTERVLEDLHIHSLDNRAKSLTTDAGGSKDTDIGVKKDDVDLKSKFIDDQSKPVVDAKSLKRFSEIKVDFKEQFIKETINVDPKVKSGGEGAKVGVDNPAESFETAKPREDEEVEEILVSPVADQDKESDEVKTQSQTIYRYQVKSQPEIKITKTDQEPAKDHIIKPDFSFASIKLRNPKQSYQDAFIKSLNEAIEDISQSTTKKQKLFDDNKLEFAILISLIAVMNDGISPDKSKDGNQTQILEKILKEYEGGKFSEMKNYAIHLSTKFQENMKKSNFFSTQKSSEGEMIGARLKRAATPENLIAFYEKFQEDQKKSSSEVFVERAKEKKIEDPKEYIDKIAKVIGYMPDSDLSPAGAASLKSGCAELGGEKSL